MLSNSLTPVCRWLGLIQLASVGPDPFLWYAHLDVQLFDMDNPSSFTGLLPEIWGVNNRTSTSQQASQACAAPPYLIQLEIR